MASRASPAGTGKPPARTFSVAQHCCLVEVLAREKSPRLGRAGRLAVLLHDAPEYVIGDMISPFKAVIGDSYKAVERRLLAAIHRRFGLPVQSSPDLVQLIKAADHQAAFLEATRLAAFSHGSEALFRPPATHRAIDGARLSETVARRDRPSAFSGAFQKTCRRIDTIIRGHSPGSLNSANIARIIRLHC